MPSTKWEQHFTVDLTAITALLDSIDLTDREVLEIGAGRGALTRLILARRPRLLHAFEIDGNLSLGDARAHAHPSTTLIVSGDVRDAVLANPHAPHFDAVIAFPPYTLLPQIAKYLHRAAIKDVILMVPPRALDLFAGFVVTAELDGTAFDPPSDGRHFIIRRGFAHAPSTKAAATLR